MEGQESYESDPSQGTVQKDLDLCTHPDVRDYRGNIRVCTRLSGKMPCISGCVHNPKSFGAFLVLDPTHMTPGLPYALRSHGFDPSVSLGRTI